MEDETGIANVIVTPDLYERQRMIVVRSKFILAEGVLQNQDGVDTCEGGALVLSLRPGSRTYFS